MVATDCLSLIQKLRLEGADRSHTGTIIQDIKQEVRASSVMFSFTHVSKWCKEVAHVLARSADQISETVRLHVVLEFFCSSM
jgi:hypothetical protein